MTDHIYSVDELDSNYGHTGACQYGVWSKSDQDNCYPLGTIKQVLILIDHNQEIFLVSVNPYPSLYQVILSRFISKNTAQERSSVAVDIYFVLIKLGSYNVALQRLTLQCKSGFSLEPV